MNHLKALCGICLLLSYLAAMGVAEGQLASASPSSGATEKELLKNPFFVDPSIGFNRGVFSVENAIDLAPRSFSWGLRGYSWEINNSDKQYPIDECTFASTNMQAKDYDIWLYGKDGSGRIGVVSLVQGWVWKDYNQPASWYLFLPLSVSDQTNLTLRAWIKHHGGPYPIYRSDSFRNVLADIWMIDESTGKTLMMDLFFFGGGLSWKENNIYHYSAAVDEVPADTWSEVVVDVGRYIDSAIEEASANGMVFDKNRLKIYQVEMMQEVKYSWGELWIGSFEFAYRPPSNAFIKNDGPEKLSPG